jgi:outer membrane protein OmpA-like peptidoglycan-associated protein
MVKGAAEIEYKQGRAKIKLSVDKLPDPRKVGAFNTTYVAWVVKGDESVESLVEVPVKKQDLSGLAMARTLGVIITAEPYGSVQLPSPLVVAELRIPDPPDPQLQSNLVSYQGQSGDVYESGLSDASAPTPDSVTPLLVLGARRSLAIARKAGAQQYAPSELVMAGSRLDSLERLWAKSPQDQSKYSELARETMRRGDNARRLAVGRREEAERKRLAEEQRQQQAAQQAALDSASQAATLARADAEREAGLRTQAEQHAADLQSRLFSSVSSILETRKEARGMIATLAGVNFETNKATLKPVAREKLSKLSGILLGYPGEYKLGIEGHTDSVGTDAHNQKLSQARAESVQAYLVTQGIPTERISSVEGLGRTRPAAPNDTPANREKNRRVEIVIE